MQATSTFPADAETSSLADNAVQRHDAAHLQHVAFDAARYAAGTLESLEGRPSAANIL